MRESMMRRIRRILSAGVAFCSLAVCLATAVVYVRSYKFVDEIVWEQKRPSEKEPACPDPLSTLSIGGMSLFTATGEPRLFWYLTTYEGRLRLDRFPTGFT